MSADPPLLSRLMVERGHVGRLIRLAVRPDQGGLVAPNAVTLAQAAYEPGACVWGLWEDETPVGLLAMTDPRTGDLGEGDDPEGAFLWRLMIGHEHQGRGLGTRALGLVLAQARGWDLPRVVTTVVDRPDAALPFYEAAGFVRTGRVLGEEIELTRSSAS